MGAVDYLAKPFAPEVLLNQVSRYVPSNVVDTFKPVCGDPKTFALLKMAEKVAQSDATVMITGPSGSGKEVLSRYVHECSKRKDGPFVAINCAAIPETMLESTLFGYEKGAFTGAVQACPGKFEQAQGGTILLDEITEIELGLQAKLLRVLQEKEVERLGSRKNIKLDIRVIATSNRDLKEAVAKGIFREDLYYRLNVFPLKWMPLRERKLDIVPIAEFILNKICAEQNLPQKSFSQKAKELLVRYNWPGNVRELDNVIQRAVILANDIVDESDLIFDDADLGFSDNTTLSNTQNSNSISSNDEFMKDSDSVKDITTASFKDNFSFQDSNVFQDNFARSDVIQPNNQAASNEEQDLFDMLLGNTNKTVEDANSNLCSSATFANNNATTDNNNLSENSVVENQSKRKSLNGELRHQEYQIIIDTLIEFNGARQAVADKLGISPRTLRYKLAKMREEGYVIPGKD